MNRKQNSLMRFSRTERLAQLSEQEIVIERKKREIQAKIEAQKKKETEEAFRKLESSRDTKSNKAEFSKKPWSRNAEKEKEISVEPEKKESLVNAFSNDGSFLDQFKKMSRTGLVDVQMLSTARQKEDLKSQEEFERSERDQVGIRKYLERDKDGDSHLSTVQRPLDSNIQLQLPPPGIMKSAPPQVPTLPSAMQSLSKIPPLLSQTHPSEAGRVTQMSSGISNAPQLNPISLSSNYQETPQPVPPVQNCLEVTGNNAILITPDQPSFLSGTQLPLPVKPQNVSSRSPVQFQNEPLPKVRTESISMILKNNTTKKLDLIPNPLDSDDTSLLPSAKKPVLGFYEKTESHKEVPCLGSMSNSNTKPVSQDKDSSRVSSAFCNDEDEDEDQDGNPSDVKYHQYAEMVARCGDEFENTLRSSNENDPNLRFLFDKSCKEYLSYRKLVLNYRRNLQRPSEDKKIGKRFQEDDLDSGENTFSGNNNKRKLSPQGSSDSDSSTKDSNINRFAGQKSETHSGNDGYQADNEDDLPYYKMPESVAKEDCFLPSQRQFFQKEEKGENSSQVEKESSEKSRLEERRKRKRKSRWGDAVASSSSPAAGTSLTLQAPGSLPAPKTTMLSQLTRSDPGLIQYARQTFGSTNLSEEDWKKAEDHYKINLLYQDMVKKRAEIDKLERAGKFKYEYDSDEDVEGGTWEHKLRQQEMMATQLWAEELTRQAAGKHHIGDFLPPEELERFMEKYNAVKEGREPDLSDYKEFKLKQDNVGYRLLQKMGWNEGQGLGQDGTGITNPVNKATTRHENQGLGIDRPDGLEAGDDEYDAYRKRMMLAYRFRPNPLNNPRRPYY